METITMNPGSIPPWPPPATCLPPPPSPATSPPPPTTSPPPPTTSPPSIYLLAPALTAPTHHAAKVYISVSPASLPPWPPPATRSSPPSAPRVSTLSQPLARLPPDPVRPPSNLPCPFHGRLTHSPGPPNLMLVGDTVRADLPGPYRGEISLTSSGAASYGFTLSFLGSPPSVVFRLAGPTNFNRTGIGTAPSSLRPSARLYRSLGHLLLHASSPCLPLSLIHATHCQAFTTMSIAVSHLLPVSQCLSSDPKLLFTLPDLRKCCLDICLVTLISWLQDRDKYFADDSVHRFKLKRLFPACSRHTTPPTQPLHVRLGTQFLLIQQSTAHSANHCTTPHCRLRLASVCAEYCPLKLLLSEKMGSSSTPPTSVSPWMFLNGTCIGILVFDYVCHRRFPNLLVRWICWVFIMLGTPASRISPPMAFAISVSSFCTHPMLTEIIADRTGLSEAAARPSAPSKVSMKDSLLLSSIFRSLSVTMLFLFGVLANSYPLLWFTSSVILLSVNRNLVGFAHFFSRMASSIFVTGIWFRPIIPRCLCVFLHGL